MASKAQQHHKDTTVSRRRSQRPTARAVDTPGLATLIQRAKLDPGSLSPQEVLQLQRISGNRAVGQLLTGTAQSRPGGVVQRLIYTQQNQTLHVPKNYGDLRIPWNDDERYSIEREPNDRDPTLSSLYRKYRDKFNQYIGAGIDQTIANMIVHEATNEDAGVFLMSLLGEKDRPTGNALRNIFLSPNRYLLNYSGVKYWAASEVETNQEWAILPKDYIPQAPDLPPAGTSLQDKIPGKMGAKWWEYACVLIALVKQEGYDSVNEKTDGDADNLNDAVQALHNYYKGKGIEYDDSSTRGAMMREWGYDLIFSGPVSFTNLRKHISLSAGKKYIFDITGHTVKVDLKKDMAKRDEDIADFSEFFTFHSDPSNYSKDETAQQVLYIFAKDE